MNNHRHAAGNLARIDLDPNNKYVANMTRRATESIELKIEELEERIAPTGTTIGGGVFRLAGNHNETLITDDA